MFDQTAEESLSFQYHSTVRKFIPIALILVLALSACGSTELSAEEKRNNFDLCKINFLKKIDQNIYDDNKDFYEKQAQEDCSPLLTANNQQVEMFVQPIPSTPPANELNKNASGVSFDSVCALVKKAAYAHREFRSDDDSEDIYDRWYGRIRGYFREAASKLRILKGNYTSLIEQAEDASMRARGVNGGLTSSEKGLYSACNISEDIVFEDFMKWLG